MIINDDAHPKLLYRRRFETQYESREEFIQDIYRIKPIRRKSCNRLWKYPKQEQMMTMGCVFMALIIITPLVTFCVVECRVENATDSTAYAILIMAIVLIICIVAIPCIWVHD